MRPKVAHEEPGRPTTSLGECLIARSSEIMEITWWHTGHLCNHQFRVVIVDVDRQNASSRRRRLRQRQEFAYSTHYHRHLLNMVKLTIKTVQNKVFTVEAEESDSVSASWTFSRDSA